jgi:hypothetical protein
MNKTGTGPPMGRLWNPESNNRMNGNPDFPAVAALLLLLAVSLFAAGCVETGGAGTLAGHVTIGPLCPVEPCHVSGEQLAQAYAARQVTVYSEDEEEIVQMVTIGPDGEYRVGLPPGRYQVDVTHDGIGARTGVPAVVTILPGQTTVVNITIDTGIR